MTENFYLTLSKWQTEGNLDSLNNIFIQEKKKKILA